MVIFHSYVSLPEGNVTVMLPSFRNVMLLDNIIRFCYAILIHVCYGNVTGKPLSLPAPTPTTCPNIKKHFVLWGKMHMSMIMAFILQRTA